MWGGGLIRTDIFSGDTVEGDSEFTLGEDLKEPPTESLSIFLANLREPSVLKICTGEELLVEEEIKRRHKILVTSDDGCLSIWTDESMCSPWETVKVSHLTKDGKIRCSFFCPAYAAPVSVCVQRQPKSRAMPICAQSGGG